MHCPSLSLLSCDYRRYYESPPGLQLLHALRFDTSVVGGHSTFLDSHAIANELRIRDPEAFDVLTRVPATFQKGKEFNYFNNGFKTTIS